MVKKPFLFITFPHTHKHRTRTSKVFCAWVYFVWKVLISHLTWCLRLCHTNRFFTHNTCRLFLTVYSGVYCTHPVHIKVLIAIEKKRFKAIKDNDSLNGVHTTKCHQNKAFHSFFLKHISPYDNVLWGSRVQWPKQFSLLL